MWVQTGSQVTPTEGVNVCVLYLPHLLEQSALLCLTGAAPFDADAIMPEENNKKNIKGNVILYRKCLCVDTIFLRTQ